MRPSLALNQNRELIRQVALSHRTCNPRVFGSVAHGSDTEASDLDILVDPLPGTTLFDLGAIQIELEERLGVSVEVLIPKDLPANFRTQAIAEAIPI